MAQWKQASSVVNMHDFYVFDYLVLILKFHGLNILWFSYNLSFHNKKNLKIKANILVLKTAEGSLKRFFFF